MTWVVMMSAMLLSGFSSPVQNMPAWLQPLAGITPLTHMLVVVRGVFLRGAGWDVLWSLSIEEAFYLGFPILCLLLPRRLLIGVLLLWALALSPARARRRGTKWLRKQT